MKTIKFLSAAAAALLLGAGFSSCEDMMDTDTTTYRYENGIRFDSAADSLYSALGIMSQLQKVGERYVLLGELRGDLVDVTPEADFSLREVSQFNVTPDNEFLPRIDYYSIINNCNFALDRMDTGVTIHGTQVLLPEYAAIKAMRAWTYLQMGLAFGSARYFTEPILSLEQSLKEYPEVELDALVPMLISDLEPYAEIDTPDYGNIDGMESRYFFIQPRLLLADLCLYNNDYDRAAQMYYNYIERFSLTISTGNGNLWNSSTQDRANIGNVNAYNNESRTMIPYSSEAGGYHPDLVNLTYNSKPSLLPARWWVDEMNDIPHYFTENMSGNLITGYLQGDLRGEIRYRNNTSDNCTFGNIVTGIGSTTRLITKFFNNAETNSSITSSENELIGAGEARLVRRVVLCRTPHIYLRFAEAANRAGKPTLAFAVLKYGLNREYMTVGQELDEEGNRIGIPVINPSELASGETWTNFAALDLGNNGTAMRGRGIGIRLDSSPYVIPELPALADSIDFVENEIVREMAAETAFEGNRFFDLLRVSHHRADHPAYFAEKVAVRFSDSEAARQRLLNCDNLWIK